MKKRMNVSSNSRISSKKVDNKKDFLWWTLRASFVLMLGMVSLLVLLFVFFFWLVEGIVYTLSWPSFCIILLPFILSILTFVLSIISSKQEGDFRYVTLITSAFANLICLGLIIFLWMRTF
jgi:hypothetical protein